MPQPAPTRLPGIDFLRVAAMGAIFVQHALSITDNDELSSFGPIRLGRLGTGTFFLLGGYFAALDSRPPATWLRHRLATLLVPFWISLAVVFVAAGVIGYKSFTSFQVVCQFSGIGLFTHPTTLVGVTTWFVSAILALYCLSYLAKSTLELPVVFGLLLLFLAIGGQTVDPRLTWVRLGSLFLIGYLIPRTPLRPPLAALAWAVPVAAVASLVPELRHGPIVLVLFACALIPTGSIPAVKWLADRSYEAYLTHGLSFHAATAVVGCEFWPALAVTIPLCFTASVSVKWLVSRLRL
jgi:peptidoglycan/LPS O-acetylase OafA/YrhL